jgi:hypothetical protein
MIVKKAYRILSRKLIVYYLEEIKREVFLSSGVSILRDLKIWDGNVTTMASNKMKLIIFKKINESLNSHGRFRRRPRCVYNLKKQRLLMQQIGSVPMWNSTQ